MMAIPKKILEHIPLKDKNWFATGGPARFFSEPHTTIDLQEAIHFAQSNTMPLFFLGHGANVLISDNGFDGLIIRPRITDISVTPYNNEHSYVTAGAGVGMPELIEYCLQNQLLGLEEFSGIPGTVGGSVFINLHYFNFLISQFLVSARIIECATGHIKEVDNQWFNFSYNYSRLHERTEFLVDATFKLRHADIAAAHYARGRHVEIIRHRKSRYPTSHTCGSFFRNFFEHEVQLELDNKKIIFVAFYLDKIGVKGSLSCGNARVSYQHANMIVNAGNATSHDIIQVARTMQSLIQQKYGITPQPECILLGFDSYPLL